MGIVAPTRSLPGVGTIKFGEAQELIISRLNREQTPSMGRMATTP